ncbi:MAG: glutamate-cysteine ligase family protein [Actinomycetota bacterium]
MITRAAVVQRAASDLSPTDEVRIGAEVEWLVFDRTDLLRAIDADQTTEIASGDLPAGGRVTVEPGGQLELVSAPHGDPVSLVEALAADTDVLVERFASRGLTLVALGLDPIRPPRRSLFAPRYDAMEAFFDVRGPEGRRMMSTTGSLQLNVDTGHDPAATWRAAHALIPAFARAFANSPTADGRTFTATSLRQRIWEAIDPSRTAAVGEQVDDWAEYALAAQVMAVERDGTLVPPNPPMTFDEWIGSATPPTAEDLERHLTTLFPPVRPRRFIELRMIDALPAEGRTAAIACAWSALVDQPDVAEEIADDDPATAATALLDLGASGFAPHSELGRAARSWRYRLLRDHRWASAEHLIDATTERRGTRGPTVRA